MKRIIVAVAGLLVVAGSVLAGTQAGMSEVQIQGSFDRSGNSENDDQDYTATGQLGYNYFLAPYMSFGGVSTLSSSMSVPEEGDETTSQTVFAMLRLSLYLTSGSAPIVPYLGGQGGAALLTWQNEDSDDSSISLVYGGFGGLKIFASEKTSWNVEGSYVIYEPDVEENEGNVTYNTAALTVGFSYFF